MGRGYVAVLAATAALAAAVPSVAAAPRPVPSAVVARAATANVSAPPATQLLLRSARDAEALEQSLLPEDRERVRAVDWSTHVAVAVYRQVGDPGWSLTAARVVRDRGTLTLTAKLTRLPGGWIQVVSHAYVVVAIPRAKLGKPLPTRLVVRVARA